MLTRAQWQHLIPHQGAMSLLDTVVDWDAARIHARAVSHRDPANPLRRDGLLRSVHLCEYGAQAMAIHGALLAQRAGTQMPPGYLVALRAVRLELARIDDLAASLDVHAEQLLADAAGLQYAFRVEADGRLLAQGRAAVLHALGGEVQAGTEPRRTNSPT